MNQSVVHLVREVQRGNEDAFTQLYEEIYSDVYRIAYANCHNHHDALDITQETFITISKSIHLLNQPETFPYWIQRVIFTTTAKYYRRQRPLAMDPEVMKSLPNQVEDQKEYLPKDQFEENEERKLIRAFISELREKHRSVIECVYLKQMSLEETSKYLNRPMGTVKSQLHVGRKQLSKLIKEYEHTHDRKIGFHTLGSTSAFGLWSLAYWKEVFNVYANVIWNVMSIATGVVIMIVSTTGIVKVSQEHDEPKTEAGQPSVVTKVQDTTKEQIFHASFQGQEITSAQDAYYAIVKWGGTPELVKDKPQNEQQEAITLLHEIETTDGIYWQRLQSEGWTTILS